MTVNTVPIASPSANGKPLRVLFRTAITQSFYDLPRQLQAPVIEAFGRTRLDLGGRLGIRVLGTFDDDRMAVGMPAPGEWTSFILADAPDLEAVIAFCDQFRSTAVGTDGELLWKYAHVDARIGRALAFEDCP